MQETVLISKPEQFDKAEILNEDDRLFKAWGSVEVRDVQGDVLPMTEFRKVMPLIMDRGGALIDSHSNRTIGKMINYEFKEHESGKEGVLLTCKVYKNYPGDDEVWEDVKKGEYTGLSFGGRSTSKEIKFEKGMEVTNILRGIEGYEFSLVKSPANKSALITEVNYLAKSDNSGKETLVKIDDLKIEKQEEVVKSLVEKLASEGNEWAMNLVKSEMFKKEKDSDKFIKNKSVNMLMAQKDVKKNFGEAPNNSAPAPMENGVEERLAKLEQAVAQILEMVQTPMNNKADEEDEKEKDKDEDVEKEGKGENKVLPKDVSEKVDEMDAGEGAEEDKVKLVEKELKELKKSISEEIKKEMAEVKKSLEANKATTPRPGSDKFINKGDLNTPAPKVSSWKEANALVRGKK